MMTGRPTAPAVARNREPILEVLRAELADCRRVLEIGSGTGEHAVFFARAMPGLHWQTSDRRDNHPGIAAWIEHARLPNVASPLDLDVGMGPDPAGRFDAVFSANTAHIMNLVEVEAMFALVGRVLDSGGRFCLYGPFRQDGEHNSASNAEFDAKLRGQDPGMGIRDLEDLDGFAGKFGLRRTYTLVVMRCLL